ncbi:hypothetical protein KHC19_13025 [Ancylobacter oerskovii]|nr:hypothetical protein [Ancylobacter oerskovii]
MGLGIGFHPPVDDGLQQHFPPLNLLDGQGWKVSDRLPGHALYTDPPLGGRHDGGGWGRPSPPLLIGEQLMNRVGRAVEKAEALGFMKVVMDAETQRILGAAIFGTGGDEAIHGLLDIMHANAPCAVFQRAVPIHPTVSERIPTLLGR